MDPYALGLLFLGFLVGALNASTGIGWGVITVPILFLLPALPARQAVAVSLLALLFSGAVASIENIRHGLVHSRYAAYLAAGGVAGGFLGAQFLRGIPTLPLRRVVGVIVIAAGVRMITAR